MRVINSIVALIFFFNVSAQNSKYWVFLNTEKCSYSIDEFSEWVSTQGFEVQNTSEWLNAVSINIESKDLQTFKLDECVTGVQKVNTYEFTSTWSEHLDTYTSVLEQINAKAFAEKGLTAKGVKVGVIDAGFVNVDSGIYYEHLQTNNQIIATRDFFNPDREDFYTKETRGCNHGAEVVKRITGFNSKKNEVTGVARDAQFYLARTENGDKESRVEEDNWVAAIEWLHKQGVRLVNTSLGYATDFDDPIDNYIPQQMNGNTALITKAAQIAVRDKGMILIVSAGNMGTKDWRIVSAPADAKEVISIGATNEKVKSKIGYSSIGADFVDYAKPDVSCFSPNGTSYSAPIITGVVACMLQKNPNLTSADVKEALYKSSHLFPYNNNFIGYGVPDSYKIIAVLDSVVLDVKSKKIDSEGASVIEIELDDELCTEAVLFHKTNEWKVQEQAVEHVKHTKSGRGKEADHNFFKEKGDLFLKIVRPEKCTHTTVQAGEYVYEIVW